MLAPTLASGPAQPDGSRRAHSRRAHSRLLGVLCLAGGLLTAMPPAAAHAAEAPGITLALPSAADVVATNRRVFVSGGQNSTAVAVTDAEGAAVTTLENLAGPTDLLLSQDRRTVFVALHGSGAVAAFDTRSLREVARYDTGTSCLNSLAQSGRWLWFGYGCATDSENNVGRIDLRATPGTTPAAPRLAMVEEPYQALFSPPLLATPAQNPNVLIVGDGLLSPSPLFAYSIGADGTLTLLRRSDHLSAGDSLADIAVTADGSTVFTASASPFVLQEFPVDAMTTPTRYFRTGGNPTAVELSPDGRYVAGAVVNRTADEVFLFNRDATVVASYSVGTTRASVPKRALAWSPNGRRLYAVSWDYNKAEVVSPAPTLHVLRPNVS
ncbi:MAG TPA: hypothetical protein VK453_13615 [Micromonosporaceae bacterium]|nr:hypothetical protein [Micromonosporaceae bacterium]